MALRYTGCERIGRDPGRSGCDVWWIGMTGDSADTDARVRATREAIRLAFNDLVLSGSFDAIRIGNLVERAGVGRSTFYEHYRSKDDVLRDAVRGVLGMLGGGLALRPDPNGIIAFLDHVASNRAASLVILRGSARAIVVDVLTDVLRDEGATELGGAFVAEATIGLVLNWLERPGELEEGQFARALIELSRPAFEG